MPENPGELNYFENPPMKVEDALAHVRRELFDMDMRAEKKSWLASALGNVSEPITGSARADRQLSEIFGYLKERDAAGEKYLTGEDGEKVRKAIDAGRVSTETSRQVEEYGSGMLKTAGLFLRGKGGYALTGLAYGLDSNNAADSGEMQLFDGGLGLVKGLATKSVFSRIGRSNLDIAGKGVLMGGAARIGELGLNRNTYLDPATGGLDWRGGVERTLAGAASPRALASDVIIFAMAHKVLGRINTGTGGAISNNPFYGTTATAGVFGISSGSFEELQRQYGSEEKLDISKVVSRALARGTTDALAAMPAGRQAFLSSRSSEAARSAQYELSSSKSELRSVSPLLPAAMERLPLSRSLSRGDMREFIIVSKDQNGAGLVNQMRNSKEAATLLHVRERAAGGELGPPKSLLVQHLHEGVQLRSALARSADLIACCNARLAGNLGEKHLFPQSDGNLYMSALPGSALLRFQLQPDSSMLSGAHRSGPLSRFAETVGLGGRSVSDVIRSPEALHRMSHLRDMESIAREMSHYKTPANRFLGGGKDNIVIELADGRVLKIASTGWQPEWGSRTFWTPDGPRRMDARILQDPVEIQVNHRPVYYFIQERASSPVSKRDLATMVRKIERDGTWSFWDRDFSSHGAGQLGYSMSSTGKRGLILLDYDAVRTPDKVPSRDKGYSERSSGDKPSWLDFSRVNNFNPGNQLA